MGAWGSTFNLLSFLYMGIAVVTMARLLRLGPKAFAEPLDAARQRLLSSASFYVLTPVAVALHELGHAALIVALGGSVVDYHFMLYWGYVIPDRSFGTYGDFAVALAGNVVTALIGAAAAVASLRWPRRAAWNVLWVRLAEIQLSMVLVLYPVFCLIGFGGDFLLIYRRATLPVSGPLLAIHLLAVVLVWRAWRGESGARLRLRASPLWDLLRRAQTQAAASPGDAQPELGLAFGFLQAGLPRASLKHAERALALAPTLGAAQALAGLASAALGAPQGAAQLSAGLADQRLDPQLRHRTRLALGTNRLRAADYPSALAQALEVLGQAPTDAAAAELLGEAARAGQLEPQALAALETASARGNLAARRELESLERSLRRRLANA